MFASLRPLLPNANRALQSTSRLTRAYPQCLPRLSRPSGFSTGPTLLSRKNIPHPPPRKHSAPVPSKSTIHKPSKPPSSEGPEPEPTGTNLKPIALFLTFCILTTTASMLLAPSEDVPDPDIFHPYTLLSHTTPSPNTHLLTLSVPPSLRPALSLTDPNTPAMLSLEVKEPNIQVSRHYTPLPGPREGTIQLYVKTYPNGSLSPYMASLRAGDIVEMRGPRPECEGIDRDLQAEESGAVRTNVLLLTGGTGVAVACQFVERYFGTGGTVSTFPKVEEGGKETEKLENPNPQIVLHHSVRTPDELQFLLDRLSSNATYPPLLASGNLQVGTHTDTTPLTPSPSLSPHRIISLLEEWQKESLQRGERTRNVVFVSGPPGFVRHWAGAKGWERGEETQGELGGVLGGLVEKWRGEGGEWGLWKF